MTRGRLEAFSDGVIAILITIMVLELVPPHGTQVADLLPLWPKFLCYVLSFAYLAIYWNNHHHLLQAAKTVSGRVLWANMLLLFWLSLVPFATSWMGENDFASQPVALYGIVLIMAAVSYYFLVRALIRAPGQAATIAEALDNGPQGQGLAAVLRDGDRAVALLARRVGAAVPLGRRHLDRARPPDRAAHRRLTRSAACAQVARSVPVMFGCRSHLKT